MTPNAAAVEKHLRASRLFQPLSTPILAELAARAARKRLDRGEHLWRQGDEATRLVLVASGLVKVVQRGAEADNILGLFGPRETIGTVAVLRGKRYPAAAVASSDVSEVWLLDPSPVLRAMETDPTAARAMNGALLAQTDALHEKISVMSAGPVPRRLATQILTLGARFGDEREDGALTIPLVLSRGELASLVGARVETTIRVLSAWQRDGILELSKDGMVVPRPGELAEVARTAL